VSHFIICLRFVFTPSLGLDYISNANPTCSCVYICKFQFRPIHPPSRRLSLFRHFFVLVKSGKAKDHLGAYYFQTRPDSADAYIPTFGGARWEN
jgi:hypothetical protein